MNKLSIFTLKASRKIYAKIFGGYQLPVLDREEDPDKVSDMIYELLQSGKPCMIARYGSTELSAIVNYLGVKNQERNIFKYIKGQSLDWWWNKSILQQMQRWSGFFPPTPEKISQFCELILEDSKQVDILASWIKSEHILTNELKNVKKINFILFEPFWSRLPWSRCLKDKKILIVHPFADTITAQYSKREKLFKNRDILPEFKSLQIIKAIQSLGGVANEFTDWFEALDYMKDEIDKRDYDICLIGCGAYGFPLAAHVKRRGKQAIHVGGSLQLLFGISGKRWENPQYAIHMRGLGVDYIALQNDHWTRPMQTDITEQIHKVENGCYT